MEKANGNGFFYKGSDGTIDYYQNNNYLCYVRQIVDKNNYKPLATLLITLDPNVLQDILNRFLMTKISFTLWIQKENTLSNRKTNRKILLNIQKILKECHKALKK